MLTILVKLFKALNSEQSPNQLAIAISLAAILGLTPFLSLHNILILFIALIFRVNLTLLILSYPLFALLGYLLSPWFQQVGSSLLQAPSLTDFWTAFFNTLIGRWSDFYYSGVMGSFVIAILTAIILYPLSRLMIVAYRHKWLDKINQIHLVKLLKTSRFWQLYSQG
ncbi:MAG: TIGR03546 family protein [Enterobacterales bacterium]|nr:TIGR03546 family protein [Enterobacterales bacterium]